MKQLIKDVLKDMVTPVGSIDLSSPNAIELVATTITAVLKSNGTYIKDNEMDKQVEREREKWVCEFCGKNTFEVDYDYIGSGTNHLGCELERDDRLKQYKKEKEKAKHLIDKSVEDYERNKLSEQIVDNKDKGYIYESPDGGKTIYKRLMGSNEKTLVSKDELEGKF
tara:strand:- start:108 stop:608 length:501 start_codon:yes stop_codon:yes gene_type:complete